MKNLKDKLIEINEERFAYAWENAFICSIIALYEKDKNSCIGIIEKWFANPSDKHELSSFLYRLGHEPKSNSAEDILDAIISTTMDSKFNLR